MLLKALEDHVLSGTEMKARQIRAEVMTADRPKNTGKFGAGNPGKPKGRICGRGATPATGRRPLRQMRPGARVRVRAKR